MCKWKMADIGKLVVDKMRQEMRSGFEWLWVESFGSMYPVAIGVEHMIWKLRHGQGLENRRVSPEVRCQSSLLCLGS